MTGRDRSERQRPRCGKLVHNGLKNCPPQVTVRMPQPSRAGLPSCQLRKLPCTGRPSGRGMAAGEGPVPAQEPTPRLRPVLELVRRLSRTTDLPRRVARFDLRPQVGSEPTSPPNRHRDLEIRRTIAQSCTPIPFPAAPSAGRQERTLDPLQDPDIRRSAKADLIAPQLRLLTSIEQQRRCRRPRSQRTLPSR
jgi:hypothetical protein